MFSGFDSVVKIGDDVKLSNNVFYVHDNNNIELRNSITLNDNKFWIDNNTNIEIGNNALFANNNFQINDNADIKIGDNVIFTYSNLYINNSSNIEIGNRAFITSYNFRIKSGTNIKANGVSRANIKIGEGVILRKGESHIFNDAYFEIGKNVTLNDNSLLCACVGTSLIIGDDCMFSFDIQLWSNDGHVIFDVCTGENINSTEQINQDRKIIIGNHVWVGARSIILYNTEIGDGSIVGAGSLVKSKIPNNCIVAGNPAKVVRKNIAWSRDYFADELRNDEKEYSQLTK